MSEWFSLTFTLIELDLDVQNSDIAGKCMLENLRL